MGTRAGSHLTNGVKRSRNKTVHRFAHESDMFRNGNPNDPEFGRGPGDRRGNRAGSHFKNGPSDNFKNKKAYCWPKTMGIIAKTVLGCRRKLKFGY